MHESSPPALHVRELSSCVARPRVAFVFGLPWRYAMCMYESSCPVAVAGGKAQVATLLVRVYWQGGYRLLFLDTWSYKHGEDSQYLGSLAAWFCPLAVPRTCLIGLTWPRGVEFGHLNAYTDSSVPFTGCGADLGFPRVCFSCRRSA